MKDIIYLYDESAFSVYRYAIGEGYINQCLSNVDDHKIEYNSSNNGF